MEELLHLSIVVIFFASGRQLYKWCLWWPQLGKIQHTLQRLSPPYITGRENTNLSTFPSSAGSPNLREVSRSQTHTKAFWLRFSLKETIVKGSAVQYSPYYYTILRCYHIISMCQSIWYMCVFFKYSNKYTHLYVNIAVILGSRLLHLSRGEISVVPPHRQNCTTSSCLSPHACLAVLRWSCDVHLNDLKKKGGQDEEKGGK